MRTLSVFVALALPVAIAPAQGTVTNVTDVGLTLQTGPATGILTPPTGQRCGPFTCTPFATNSTLAANTLARTVRVYGNVTSIYILAMSVGAPLQPCIALPGIDNQLILGQPAAAISIGTLALAPSTLACQQGSATYVLTLPAVAPAVIPYHLQALTFSFTTQAPAFTVAIRDEAR